MAFNRPIAWAAGLLLAAFLFPKLGWELSGPFSIRGPVPYDAKLTVTMGPLPKPWASLEFLDRYDGSFHYSEGKGHMGTSPNWWIFLAALVTAVAAWVFRKNESVHSRQV
jgi:hypothetical protein